MVDPYSSNNQSLSENSRLCEIQSHYSKYPQLVNHNQQYNYDLLQTANVSDGNTIDTSNISRWELDNYIVNSYPQTPQYLGQSTEKYDNYPLPTNQLFLNPYPVTSIEWDIKDAILPQPEYYNIFEHWPDGDCLFIYSASNIEARKHKSGWAMRNTNNHNKMILKKSCLGVVKCSQGCWIGDGELKLSPRISEAARRNQLSNKKCPNVKCSGQLVQKPCQGKSGNPVTHYWRYYLPTDSIYFMALGVHDHERPSVNYRTQNKKTKEEKMRRVRKVKQCETDNIDEKDSNNLNDKGNLITKCDLVMSQPLLTMGESNFVPSLPVSSYPNMPVYNWFDPYYFSMDLAMTNNNNMDSNLFNGNDNQSAASKFNILSLTPPLPSTGTAAAAAATAAAALVLSGPLTSASTEVAVATTTTTPTTTIADIPQHNAVHPHHQHYSEHNQLHHQPHHFSICDAETFGSDNPYPVMIGTKNTKYPSILGSSLNVSAAAADICTNLHSFREELEVPDESLAQRY